MIVKIVLKEPKDREQAMLAISSEEMKQIKKVK